MCYAFIHSKEGLIEFCKSVFDFSSFWNFLLAKLASKNNIMAIFKLNINGKIQEVDVDPTTPILWVLRDSLNLQGTKYGCGIANAVLVQSI